MAFERDLATVPSISLRVGNELDDYRQPTAFNPDLDTTTDDYLDKYHWGIAHLDAASWRYYVPHLVSYSIRHFSESSNTIDSFLGSLRPPDREPSRLGSLTPDQENAIKEFLEFLAFSDGSEHQELACQTIEEWWIPGALYRPGGPPA